MTTGNEYRIEILEADNARLRERNEKLEGVLGDVYRDSLTAHVHGRWTNEQLADVGGAYELNWRNHEATLAALEGTEEAK